MPAKPINLAVLVSGGGTTLQNLLDCIAVGSLDARVGVVIGSRAGLVGLERAKKAGVPHFVVDRREFTSISDFSHRVFSICDEAKVDLVCLAGWLSLLQLPTRYHGKMMNIHPALLPSFGGKGMYGKHVHQAVIDHGCKVSGCTVHFVDDQYDSGPIIVQRTCPVLETDEADSLAHRVFEEEKIAYPEAIRLFQQGRLQIKDRRVNVVPSR